MHGFSHWKHRRFASVTSQDVTPKPIFAISDGPGLVAELVAKPLGAGPWRDEFSSVTFRAV